MASIREVIRVAKDRHTGTQGYAEALLLQYNKRLKYPLRWNSLHGNPEQSTDNQEQFALEDTQMELEDDSVEDYEDEDEDEVPNHLDALSNQPLMEHLDMN